jgi:hypothetical protein
MVAALDAALHLNSAFIGIIAMGTQAIIRLKTLSFFARDATAPR